jgi:hypothetical protein
MQGSDWTLFLQVHDNAGDDAPTAVDSIADPDQTRSIALWVRQIALISAFALCLSLTAGAVSLSLSRWYYRTAPYHYDSAAYRVAALEVHDVLKSRGLRQAERLALRTKDSLDILLRLLIVPSALQHRYGHMAILIPFLGLFIALTCLYVYRRTGSASLAILCPATLFVYPCVYSPYWGIADYWKDNLAAWMLGASLVSWLLSENLRKRSWTFASGLLLGLVVMQRTGTAVLWGPIALSLLVAAVVHQGRRAGGRAAILRASVFVLPAATLASIVLLAQGRDLYDYYTKTGYAYGTYFDVMRFLLSGVSSRLARPVHDFFAGTGYGVGVIPFVMTAEYLGCFLFFRGRRLSSRDMWTALFATIGLPAVVVATSTYYYGFFVLWTALLIVVCATLCPVHLGQRGTVALALLLGVSIVSGALLQYRTCAQEAAAMARLEGGYRTLLMALAELVTADGRPDRAYATFFNETGAPFVNHVRFDLKRRIGPPTVPITFHDEHFKRFFPGATPEEIVRSEMRRLESHPDPIAVGHANIHNLYQPRSDPLASAVVRGFNAYLRDSPAWCVTQELASPFGPVYVYRLSSALQTRHQVDSGEGEAKE